VQPMNWSARGVPERKKVNYFIEINPSGAYIVENYIPSGGSALMNWYKNNFGHFEVSEAEKTNKNIWKSSTTRWERVRSEIEV